MLILLILAVIPCAFIVTGMLISAPGYTGPPSDHFNGKRFLNYGGVRAKGGKEVMKWMLNRKRKPWKEIADATHGKRPLDHFRDGIRITFVNHSTFLIQLAGLNILTDPVWCRRASPFSWAGPKRMRPPGIRFEDLPRIHCVLLSHNHYDHLDVQTLRMVMGAHHPRIIAPLGIAKFLNDLGIPGTTELDWWQDTTVGDQLSVVAIPAQHFSGRGLLDRDATLWCGYLVRSPHGNLYFAGDTGYSEELFTGIAERIGPVRISILPIGAYKPRWFMSPIHTSPEEAVMIHQLIGSQVSIACHHGTFPLADDDYDDPRNDLAEALTRRGISDDEFRILKEGDPEVFN